MLSTLGGLALFLLGIERIAASLQALSGTRMRRAMAGATRSPWRALTTGTAVSAATQSGTATAVTALGLVASGLVRLREGIALSLGAKVGATLAIQLAAFKVTEAALPLIGVGFVVALWRPSRHVGGLLLGVGLLFLGLDLTVGSVAGLQSSDLFGLVIDGAERQPLAVALVGALLGAALSSTNGVAAIALGLFAGGAVSLTTALALVLGGNVGGTLLALLAARSLDVAARRVALAHTLAKAVGAVALTLAVVPAAGVIAALGGDEARQIANAHTLFNVAVAVLGTLLVAPLAALVTAMIPTREDVAGPKYLRANALDDPPLATALALRETVRISDQVATSMEQAVGFLRSGEWDDDAIEARESKIDRLTRAVVEYLATLRRTHGEAPVSERLLLLATELEHMGDQVRRMQRRESRLRESGIEFSKDGRDELADTAEEVLARMRAAFTALATGDVALATQVVAGRPTLERLVADMRLAHLARLEARLPESRASSSHHLEVLTLMRQMDASTTRVAGWVKDGLGTQE